MARLEFPHINVLSKVDLIEKYGELAFNLDFYTDVQDLRYLLQPDVTSTEATSTSSRLERFRTKFQKMNELLIDVIEDFSLVSFHPLNIEDGENMQELMNTIDKSNGFVFQNTRDSLTNMAFSDTTNVVRDVQEKYTCL